MTEAATRASRWVGALAALALLAACDWAQPNFGPERSRFNPTEHIITPDNVDDLAVRWTNTYTGSVSGPLVSDGRAVVTHVDTAAGTIDEEAVAPATGAPLWDTNLLTSPGSTFLFHFASAFDGDRYWSSYADPAGIGLVRLDRATGAIIGSESAGFVASPVTSGSGVLAYLVSDTSLISGTLVVRDPTTLDTLWTAPLPALATTLAVANGRIYVAAGQNLLAYDAGGCGAATCSPIWSWFDADGPTYLALAVGPADQVLTVQDFTWAQDTHGQQVPRFGTLEARAGATGQVLWRGAVTAPTGLAVTDDTVFVTERQVRDNTPTGTFGAFRLAAFPVAGCAGSLPCAATWQATFADTPLPPIVGGDVLFTAVGGTLHALDARGCGAATCTPLTSRTGVGSPETIANGRLYTLEGTASGTTLRALTVG